MGVGADLYMYNVVAKKFTFAISSPDEFLLVELLSIVQFYVHVGTVRSWTGHSCTPAWHPMHILH